MKTFLIASVCGLVLSFILVSPSFAERPLSSAEQAIVDSFAKKFNEELSWTILIANERLISDLTVNSLMMWRCGETGNEQTCESAAASVQETEDSVPLALQMTKTAITLADRVKNAEIRKAHIEGFKAQISKIENASLVNVLKNSGN